MKFLLLSISFLGASAQASTFFICPSSVAGLQQLEVHFESTGEITVVEDSPSGKRLGYHVFDQGKIGNEYTYGRVNRTVHFSKDHGVVYNLTVEFGDGTVFNCDEK